MQIAVSGKLVKSDNVSKKTTHKKVYCIISYQKYTWLNDTYFWKSFFFLIYVSHSIDNNLKLFPYLLIYTYKVIVVHRRSRIVLYNILT